MSQRIEQGDQRRDSGPLTGLEALQRSSAFRGPVGPIDEHDHSNDHLALLYESRDEQLAAAIPFVRHGLERGERCLYIADENSRETILEALRDSGVDVDDALESGALVIHTVSETYVDGGTFDLEKSLDLLERAIEEGISEFEGFRVTAEETWLLRETGAADDFMALESRVNDLLDGRTAAALCQYNRERFPADVLHDVIKTHPHLVSEGTVSQNVHYTPPETFFGPETPDSKVDRMVRTLRERTEAKSDVREHERSLRKLYETTANRELSFEETVERLLELGCDRFDLRGGALAHRRSSDGTFSAEVTVGPDLGDLDGELPVQPTDGSFCCRAVEWDEPTAVPDVIEAGWDDDPVYETFGIRTYFGIGVTDGTEPYGTFWFYDTTPRDEPFTEDEHTFLELMGHWISTELGRRSRERAQRELYELTADTDCPFEETVERLLDLGCHRFGLEMGLFLEKEGDEFRVVKTCGTDLEEGFATLSANPGQYCKRTITVDVPVGVEDTEAVDWDDDPLYREYGFGCYLGTKVTDGTGVYGTVCFADRSARDREFTDAEYTFLDLMGQWLSHELERRRRESELRRSRDQFERIFESSHDAIYITDPYADEILEANEAGCEMLGYSRDELLERGPSDFHPDEMETFGAFVDDVYEEGSGWTDELTCLRRDGRPIPVEMSASTVVYDGRRCLLAIVRDISERKERERELERAERQFEAVFNNPVSFVGLLDPDGTVRRINETALEFAGVEESAVRGETFWETPWFAHSEAIRRELADGIARAADGEYVRAEIPHRSSDGEIAIMDSMLEPVMDDDGDVVAIVPSGHDITELRDRERFQRRLYEIVADPDRSFDEQLRDVLDLGCERFDMDVGGIATVDPETDRFEVEITNDDHDYLVPGERYPLSETYCQASVTEDGTSAITDPLDNGFGGKLCYDRFGVRAYLGTYLELDGTDDRTFWFVSDESREALSEAERTFHHLLGQWVRYELDRKQYERNLEEAVEQLQQSNDRLKQFAYAASHDLQEPLRMVSSYLQLLENRYGDDLDEDAREYIGFAVDGAERMREMIDDLLAFSRVEHADGEFESVDCDALLERVRDDLHVRLEEADAEVVAEPLPTVRADREQLEQLFGNLVSNGIKYNESDVPRVEITVEDRGDRWEFAVADNGIGIDSDDTDLIFEVFKRLHHDDEYQGTGIGLSLCQEIADNHGGDIRVDSEPGEGSTFYVTLPKRR